MHGTSLPVLTCPLSAVVWLPQHSVSQTARQVSEQQVFYREPYVRVGYLEQTMH